MILQSMTNASGVSDGTMDINFVEPNRSKSPSPASTSGDASEASLVETGTPSGPTPEPPLKTKTKTPFKALRPCRKIDVPENLAPVPVGPRAKGEGLPYAPEGFPNPEDKWMWKVGKRKNSSGYWIDRYLILPKNLQEGAKQTYFWTKKAAEKYMMERFPEVDLESFFASFIWSVPSTGLREANGGEDMISSSAKRVRKSDIIVHERACNAGNAKCCLETGKGKISKHMDCDICCVESGFCRECSCILCGKCVDHDLDEYYFIQCQEKLSEEFICGHVAHLECAIICQTGGVVRSIGLDVEYYCRRCDKKTDLLKHVLGLITTPGSGKLRSDVENSLNLALGLIQGTQQMRCRSLENLIQKGVKKLQSGMELQDIFGDVQDNSGTVNADIGYNVKDNAPLLKPSNISPMFLSKSGCNGDILRDILHRANSPVCTTGDINQGTEVISRSPLSSSIRRSGRLQSRTVAPDVFPKKGSDQFQQIESISEDVGPNSDLHNLPAKLRVLEFENKIYQALHILRQSQEREYKIAQEKLFAQKDLVLTLFQQVDEANSKFTKNTLEKAAQKEHEKLVHMLGIADGFGSTSTEFLHDFFGMR